MCAARKRRALLPLPRTVANVSDVRPGRVAMLQQRGDPVVRYRVVLVSRHLRLVTDPAEHQFKECDGTLPGTAMAACRHCGEESTAHIARQCAGGVSLMGPRCEADATFVVPWGPRRIPFCPGCAGRMIDLAWLIGVGLSLEPIAAGTS